MRAACCATLRRLEAAAFAHRLSSLQSPDWKSHADTKPEAPRNGRRRQPEKEGFMNRFTKLALLLSIPMAASALSHPALAGTLEERTLARLDALERENAALRQRLLRVE